jgi:hypothetical protein
MIRNASLMLCVLFAGCDRVPVSPETLMPPALAGWNRLELSSEPLCSAPPEVRALGLQQAHRAAYRGPGTLYVTLYSMSSSTSAFELAQKWKPATDAAVFYQENHFVVIDWRDAPRSAVQAFVNALQKHLKSASS